MYQLVSQGKAMREQAVLREEMQYHYRVGNVEVLKLCYPFLCIWRDIWCSSFLISANVLCYYNLSCKMPSFYLNRKISHESPSLSCSFIFSPCYRLLRRYRDVLSQMYQVLSIDLSGLPREQESLCGQSL